MPSWNCNNNRLRRTVALALMVLGLSLAAAGAPSTAQAQVPKPAAQPTQAAPANQRATDADVDALIKVLQNDQARQKLIERLKAASQTPPTPAEKAAAVQQTLAGALALYTRQAVEGAAGIVDAVHNLTDEVTQLVTGAADIDLPALRRVVLAVAFVVAGTFAAYLVLQILFRWLQGRLARRAEGGRAFKRIRLAATAALTDVATVLLAWAAGFGVALFVGRTSRVGIEQSLFLNAFLIIQLIKVCARTLLAPRWTLLRGLPADDTTAAYWYFWLSRLVSLVGYTFLFAAPLLTIGVSARSAAAVRTIVLFMALAIVIAIILQNRDRVRGWLERRTKGGRTSPMARPLYLLARIWHVLAIVYLIVVFALWITDGNTALPFVLMATAQTAVAILIGALLNGFIYRLALGGMRLPPDVKTRLPLLESRLNAFVPNVLRVVRIIISVAVVLTIVQAWRLADVAAWLASDGGQRLVASLASAALVLLLGGIVYLAVHSWIEYRLSPAYGKVTGPRERTLLALFRNAFTIVLFVVVFMLVLAELGVNIAPLLAGAGVVGLALGFGSQKLVQDVINGAFIQFENTMNEGDVVTAGGVTGVVERLTIRSVSLRSLDGTYHVVPFSSVNTVSNLMKHFSYHLAAIGVAYRESIPEVKAAMEEAFARLKKTEYASDIIDALEMHGVTEFADSAVIVRARIKTLPGKQWALGRAYNEIVKEVFDERNIEIPFPHVTLYLGEDKQGNAPPLHVRADAAELAAAVRQLPDETADEVNDEVPEGLITEGASN